MSKVFSSVIEILILGLGLYFLVTTLGSIAGYYTIGEGYGWVHLFFLVIFTTNTIFYILIRIGMETKRRRWFFIPPTFYLLIMLFGSGAWFSSPFFQGFLVLGGVGLLFVALPILILLTLRHLFLKLLAPKK